MALFLGFEVGNIREKTACTAPGTCRNFPRKERIYVTIASDFDSLAGQFWGIRLTIWFEAWNIDHKFDLNKIR